jgi:hypothetical protein
VDRSSGSMMRQVKLPPSAGMARVAVAMKSGVVHLSSTHLTVPEKAGTPSRPDDSHSLVLSLLSAPCFHCFDLVCMRGVAWRSSRYAFECTPALLR